MIVKLSEENCSESNVSVLELKSTYILPIINSAVSTLRRKISAYCVKTFKMPINLNFK
jgi:hypothetical protein